MKISIDQIKPNPENPRVIKDDKFKKLVKSLKDFPEMTEAREIVVNKDYMVLGGNMRLRAMKEAGWTEVPVKVVDWSTEKQKEFVIKDNASFGEWDYDVLANQHDVAELDAWGVDLPDYEEEQEVEEDEAPEVSDEPAKSKLGEVYQLGRHRVMCGDATHVIQTDELLDGEKIDMIFTSPPYWVGFEYENEDQQGEVLLHIEDICRNLAKRSKRFVVNTGNISSITTAEKLTGKKQVALLVDWWRDAMNRQGMFLRHIRIWAKLGGMTPSRKNDKIDMHWEYIANFTDKEHHSGLISTFNSENSNPTQNDVRPAKWAVLGVWGDIQGAARGSDHVAAFPVALPARYTQMYTKKGELVYDCYGGSGSTLIACEQLSRTCYMMELDPKYCDVIRKRYWKFVNDGDETGWEENTPRIATK